MSNFEKNSFVKKIKVKEAVLCRGCGCYIFVEDSIDVPFGKVCSICAEIMGFIDVSVRFDLLPDRNIIYFLNYEIH